MSKIEFIARLAARFHSLPGVGLKTAERYAYAIISMSEEEAREFAESILDVKRKIRLCSVCGDFTDREVCPICQSRDKSVICVVKEPKDVIAMEKLKDFKGVYHVLHGVLDPLNNVGPDDIRVKELLKRLDGVKEVIMALNSDANGEATSMYISRLLKPLGVRVTRLGSGLPANSDIEYADELTLLRAMTDRKEI